MSDVFPAYERIKEALGVKKQKDLAAILGKTQASVSEVCRRRQIPDSWLFTLLSQKGLNPEWILKGTGSRYLIAEKSLAEKAKDAFAILFQLYPGCKIIIEQRDGERVDSEAVVNREGEVSIAPKGEA